MSPAPDVAEQGVELIGLLDHRVMRGAAERHHAGVDAPRQGAVLGLKCLALKIRHDARCALQNGRRPGPTSHASGLTADAWPWPVAPGALDGSWPQRAAAGL